MRKNLIRKIILIKIGYSSSTYRIEKGSNCPYILISNWNTSSTHLGVPLFSGKI